ncbi:MAG: AmmeMemoRadiSam system radical SAM enzyme [Candidatus Omnitrophica bacterium]|nr:AmmeMemoRadiSam system radical SAM enzyme [Candidatus Omnitrophota bacterium]
MKQALFYKKKNDDILECYLCAHNCLIADSKTGLCGVRKNIEGVLYSLNYAKVVAAAIDPIEKKPLFHFLPKSLAYSIACVGCNFRCGFCQNWQISQTKEIRGNCYNLTVEKIVKNAVDNKCSSIAYTYTEPTVYFEFAYDCCKLAKENKLSNVFVTNGYTGKSAIERIAPFLDAANIDLKSFSNDFYQKTCKASLAPVLDTITLMKQLGVWVEITTLIVPGLNDSSEELSDIASFIANLDKNIPWHISRFHPDYKFSQSEATPLATLNRAFDIGKKKGLNFIYIGNIIASNKQNTYCSNCRESLIERVGFSVVENNLEGDKCKYCSNLVAGIWE